MADEYLVIVDADRIHEYVFSPHRLKLIRGASALQARLNETELVAGLDAYRGNRIYAGGGTVLARFDDAGRAREYCRWAEQLYTEATWAATATSAACDLDESNFRESMKRLKTELERRKTGRREHGFNGSTPYWKTCEACGFYPASIHVTHEGHLCNPCHIRWSNRGETARGLDAINGRAGKNLEPPKDFSEIGRRSTPDNYMALIYLDVNRLGQHLHERRSDSAQTYEAASNAVKSAIKEAFFEGCADIARRAKPGAAPFEILLLGGDDAVIAMAAHEALAFLEKFKTVFEAEAGKSPGDEGLTVSAGLVWAHATYPISQFVNKAELLLKSAKRSGQGFAVDFMVVTEAMTGEPDRTTAPTWRPYGWNELIDLRRHLVKWKKGMPSSKVHELYRIAYEPVMQADLDYLFLRSRLSEGEQKLLRDVIPGDFRDAMTGRTKAADVVELWDFVEAR